MSGSWGQSGEPSGYLSAEPRIIPKEGYVKIVSTALSGMTTQGSVQDISRMGTMEEEAEGHK